MRGLKLLDRLPVAQAGDLDLGQGNHRRDVVAVGAEVAFQSLFRRGNFFDLGFFVEGGALIRRRGEIITRDALEPLRALLEWYDIPRCWNQLGRELQFTFSER